LYFDEGPPVAPVEFDGATIDGRSRVHAIFALNTGSEQFENACGRVSDKFQRCRMPAERRRAPFASMPLAMY
jgi:hypothetical protein